MTDFRALCTRLIELWDADCDIDVEINELRAALAESEPEGPTDEELVKAAKAALDDYRYATELPYFLSEDSSEYEPFMLAIRAAIAVERARWGRPTPQPEPERPTDQEIIAFWSEHCAGDGDAGIIRLARWGRSTP